MGMLAIAPTRHEHRLGRHGRAELAQHDRAGRRRLQVDRRRRARGRSWASRRRSTSAASQIDPRNANVVYVAALGPAWKAGGDRGLYKTTDGGTTWKLIKAGANDKTGAIDVAARSVEPRRHLRVDVGALSHAVLAELAAASGSGLFKSTDGGATWTEIKGNGYPEGPKGRIGIAIVAQQSAGRLRADRSGVDGAGPDRRSSAIRPANGLYRSTDGGKTWTHMNNIDTRPFYYSQVRVDPEESRSRLLLVDASCRCRTTAARRR